MFKYKLSYSSYESLYNGVPVTAALRQKAAARGVTFNVHFEMQCLFCDISVGERIVKSPYE